MVHLAGSALAGALLLDAAVGDWLRGVSGVTTVELPPVAREEAGDADVDPVVARLQATPGVGRVKLLPRAEMATRVEPGPGDSETTAQLALPRLIDVRIEPAHPSSFAGLRAEPATAAPGAPLDDAPSRLDRPFDSGFSIRAMSVSLVPVGIAAASTTTLATPAVLAVRQNVIEILHIRGARDSRMARQFARQAPGRGLRGGPITLIAAGAMPAPSVHGASTRMR